MKVDEGKLNETAVPFTWGIIGTENYTAIAKKPSGDSSPKLKFVVGHNPEV
jgi:hypothetical protein